MKKKFEIEFQKHEPFRIKWLSDEKRLSEYKISLDLFKFFDENNEDDIELFPIKQSLQFRIRDMGNNIFDILLGGTIELDFADEILDKLKKVDFSVDYSLDLIDENGEYAEIDDHYEFVENYNRELIPIED